MAKGMLNCSKAQEHLHTNVQKILKLQKIQKIRNPKNEIGHIISVNHQNADHMEWVFSIIRKTFDPKPTDNLTDLDVNTAIR